MSKTNGVGTTLEHRIGPRGRFSLRQASGDVLIRGVEGDTVRVTSLDDKTLSDQFDVQVGDGVVELRHRGLDLGVLRRSSGADLKIEVPHGATVAIDTGSADISASDLSGTKKFRTASGEVRLTRLAGGVEVETVSGEIEIEGGAPLDLLVTSVSGDVVVRVPTVRQLDLGTTSGDIRLDAALDGPGPFAIRSISGDATIVGRTGLRIEAESITGDLSSDLPSKRESLPGRKVLVVGKSGPTIAFRSVSGDMHIAEPRDAAAALEDTPAKGDAAPDGAPAGNVQPDGDEQGTEERRLDVLRALERGDITVAEATNQLGQLDEVLR
jgi:DUF4097 and DUF4098 domain-containing protein YvlB